MELIDFIKRLEKIQQGHKADFNEKEKEFLESEYFKTQGHYFPKSCGVCIQGYKVLLNIANVEKGKIKQQPKPRVKEVKQEVKEEKPNYNKKRKRK